MMIVRQEGRIVRGCRSAGALIREMSAIQNALIFLPEKNRETVSEDGL
jgi:hypothetical protein